MKFQGFLSGGSFQGATEAPVTKLRKSSIGTCQVFCACRCPGRCFILPSEGHLASLDLGGLGFGVKGLRVSGSGVGC